MRLSTIILIIAFCLITHSSFGYQVYTVAYTYGFIELRKHGQQIWERVQKDQKISELDLIRIPPGAVFRIQKPDGEFMNIPPGQEMRVKELIKEASKFKRPKIAGIFENTTGLPTNSEVIKTKPEGKKKLSNQSIGLSVNSFTGKIIVDEAIEKMVAKIHNGIAKEILMDYSSVELALAYHLLYILQDVSIRPVERANPTIKLPSETLSSKQGTYYDCTVLYCALLQAAGIPSDIQLVKNNAYILFNSGLVANDYLKLTTNSGLYLENEGYLWIPLHIKVSKTNFLNAWYHGRKLVYKLKLKNLDKNGS